MSRLCATDLICRKVLILAEVGTIIDPRLNDLAQ